MRVSTDCLVKSFLPGLESLMVQGIFFKENLWSVIFWWRHQMETVAVLLALFGGNSPVTGEFPSQRPVTWVFDVFFDLLLE